MKLRLTTLEPLILPLAADPAVKAVNDHAALSTYTEDSQDDAITVPDDATLVTVKALTSTELGMAEVRAGRQEKRGERLFLEMVHAGQVARLEAAKADKDEDTDSGYWLQAGREMERFHEELSDADALSLDKHQTWLRRRDMEVCRLGLISVTGLEELENDRGYPVEELERAISVVLTRTHEVTALFREIAGHIRNVGTLGKAKRTS